MAEKDPFLNRNIDEYKIEALLGVGGMARVYRGVDMRLKRRVAVKIIGYPHQQDKAYITRFEREAQVIAQLSHPNVVPLYRYGEKDGFLYMVMQYIDGSDLHSILSSYRSDGEFMDLEDALRIARDICLGLDYVHARGVIHRDIKPSNILLDREGRAYLSDFGLALVTDVGTLGEVFGSPQYMAPEQSISSANAEARSDLYSMGVILYEIFTGRTPFEAADPLELAMMHLNDPVPLPRSLRPEITPRVEAVLLKTLSKNPQDRYSSGADLLEALTQAARGPLLPEAPPPSTISRLTVLERVRLKTASKPTPPLLPPRQKPRAGHQAAETGSPFQPAPPKQPAQSRRITPWIIGAGLAGLLLFGLACAWLLWTGIRLGTRLVFGDSADATQTIPADVVTAGSPSDGATPGAPPTTTPPVEHRLQIIKNGKDAILILNNGQTGLPLESIQFGNPPNYIQGIQWGVGILQPNECVSAKGERAKDKKQAVNDCDQIGADLELTTDKPFWMSSFNIYYRGEFIGACAPDIDQCELRFSPNP